MRKASLVALVTGRECAYLEHHLPVVGHRLIGISCAPFMHVASRMQSAGVVISLGILLAKSSLFLGCLEAEE